jgi:GAF domain-containing protein
MSTEQTLEECQRELTRARGHIRAVLKTINSVVVQFSPDQEAFLDKVSAIIREAFRFDHVAIFVSDSENPILTKQAQSSKFEKDVPKGIGQLVSQGLIGHCAANKVPFYVNDVKGNDPLVASVAARNNWGDFAIKEEPIPRDRYLNKITGTMSELCCPIVVDDEVRGVLNIEHESLNCFVPGLLEGFMAVCKHIGNVLQYAEKSRRYLEIQTEADLVKDRLNFVLDVLGNMNVMPRLSIER